MSSAAGRTAIAVAAGAILGTTGTVMLWPLVFAHSDRVQTERDLAQLQRQVTLLHRELIELLSTEPSVSQQRMMMQVSQLEERIDSLANRTATFEANLSGVRLPRADAGVDAPIIVSVPKDAGADAAVEMDASPDAAQPDAAGNPAGPVICMGPTQWRPGLGPGRYRFTLVNMSPGLMSDASLCTENERGSPDCWQHFLEATGRSWETSIPGNDTRMTVWARQASNAAGAMKTACAEGAVSSIAHFEWEDGARFDFRVEKIP